MYQNKLSLYSSKLYIGIVILITFTSSARVPSISVEHFPNSEQFLNATCAIAPSAISAVSTAFLLFTVIFPVTKTYASE